MTPRFTKAAIIAATGTALAGGVMAATPAHADGDRPTGVANARAWQTIVLYPNGSITVSAGLKCQPGWVSSDLSMTVSQGAATGSGYTTTAVPCDGDWHPVRFRVTDISGTFVPGSAHISDQFLVNNAETGDSAGAHNQRTGLIRRH